MLDHDGGLGQFPTQAELAKRLEKSQQLISHHLRTLQKFGLVERRKMGVKNRYKLTREAVFLLETSDDFTKDDLAWGSSQPPSCEAVRSVDFIACRRLGRPVHWTVTPMSVETTPVDEVGWQSNGTMQGCSTLTFTPTDRPKFLLS